MNPPVKKRRSIRLKGYDYSQAGAYFVTICTQNQKCLFGQIADRKMVLNDAGIMVQAVWDEIPHHYDGIEIDQFVIMPNHIHGIIIVGATPQGCPDQRQSREVGQPRGVAPTKDHVVGQRQGGLSLPDVVHRFKTLTTKRYADGVKQHGWPSFPGRLWQRNYFEHVVRNEDELNLIRQYIVDNPLKWELDRENPNVQRVAGQPQGVGQPRGVAPTGNRVVGKREGVPVQVWMNRGECDWKDNAKE